MIAPVSPWDMQAAQMLTGFAMAGLIGTRFLPPRWRQKAGIAVTVLYIAGAAAFLSHLAAR